MTEPQLSGLVLLLIAAGVMAWGRWPRALVAMVALFAGIAIRVVPANAAFAGLGSDAVVILAATTTAAAAAVRSGAVEVALRPLLRRLAYSRAQLPLLAAVATLLAAGMRRAAATATLDPIASRFAARTGTPVPTARAAIATAATLGGLVTLVGAAPNLVVAWARGPGRGFAMLDFAPVGLGTAAVGLLALWIAYRLLPEGRGPAAVDPAGQARSFTAEARVPADSLFVARRVGDVEEAAAGTVRIALIVRERFRRLQPRPDRLIHEEDRLLLCGDPDDIERLVTNAGLVLQGDEAATGEAGAVLEGVVTTDSPLAGATAETVRLRERHALSLLAVARRGTAIERPLRYLRIAVGDLLILKGERDRIDDAMEALRILPLSDRQVSLGARRRSWWPLAVLAAALAGAALGPLPAAVAMAAAAVAVLLLRAVTPDEALQAPGWSTAACLAALLPLAEAVRASGADAVLAAGLVPAVAAMPGIAAVASCLTLTLAAGWWLGGLATALILAPVAAAVGAGAAVGGDALLMAVAVGATAGAAASGVRGDVRGRWLAGGIVLLVLLVGAPLIDLVWARGG